MKNKFQYKEIDSEGLETLEVISDAGKFNQWMYRTIKPYCFGKVLEIGSGTGNISQFFLKDNFQITLSDIRENYCGILAEKFVNFSNLNGIIRIDLVHPDFEKEYAGHLKQYDSVFALNVVEHIKNDKLAVSNCKKLLKDKGNIIILAPAYQSLYNQFDKELFHFRRYSQTSLNNLITSADFKIIHKQYFNLAGILGWYVSGKLQKNKTIPKDQMALYNFMVPVLKFIDKITFNLFGLSVITVGQNNIILKE